jgi:DNA-3-methyladenine glycosylase II
MPPRNRSGVRRRREAIAAGIAHLRNSDPVLRALMDRVGPFRIRLERDRFRALIRSIVSQQISGRAAASIFARLQQVVGSGGLTASNLSSFRLEQLRGAGISPQKALYLLDLAQKVLSNQVRLRDLGRRSDAEVIAELIQVKGVGVWTAQMFLIFSLGRLDVFPPEDLGIRMALRKLYGLKHLPDRTTGERIASAWRPFATLGSWYCWRSLELR